MSVGTGAAGAEAGHAVDQFGLGVYAAATLRPRLVMRCGTSGRECVSVMVCLWHERNEKKTGTN